MLFQLPTVCDLSLMVNAEKRKQDEHGCVGKLKPGDQLSFQIKIGSGHDAYLHPFDCEYEKAEDGTHKLLPSRAKPIAPGERVWRYDWSVDEYRGKPRLDYDHTRTRILALQESGHFAVYDVGVLLRGNEAFVVDWQRFRGQAYQENGTLRAPAVEQWKSLQGFMQDLLGPQRVKDLPDISEYVEPEPKAPPLANWARVTSFDPWSGLGRAILNDGSEAVVHWSQITNSPHRVAVVEPDQTVRYEELQPPAEGQKLPQIRKVEIV